MKSLKRKQKGPALGSSYRIDDSNTLCVNCRGCDQFPDSCSQVCISCICEAIASNGTAERIRLVSSKDIEISGGTAELICSLARIRRPLLNTPKGRQCSRCPRSPMAILDATWSDFPDPDFKRACARLYSDSNDGPECIACMQRTYNAISATEKEMDSIRSKAKELCRSKGVSE